MSFAGGGSYENSFRPQINKHSQNLHIVPLQERAGIVMQEKNLKKAQLMEHAEEEFNSKATFAPALDRVSEKLVGARDRVPLKDRTNYPREMAPIDDPEATHAPRLNETSKKLIESGAREAQHQAQEVKRKVKELWTRYSATGGQMIWSEVQQCLSALKLDPSGDLGKKFYVALGFDGPHGNKYIEFQRFSSVFTSVIQSAVISSKSKQQPPSSAATSRTSTGVSQRPKPDEVRPSAKVGRDKQVEAQIYEDEMIHQPHKHQKRPVEPNQPIVPQRSAAREATNYFSRDSQSTVKEDRASSKFVDPHQELVHEQSQRRGMKQDVQSISGKDLLKTTIPKREVASRYATTSSTADKKHPSREEAELAECTFGPAINKHISTNSVAQRVKKERVKSTAERELELCSFKPRTNPTNSTSQQKFASKPAASGGMREIDFQASPEAAAPEASPGLHSGRNSAFSPPAPDFSKNCPGFEKTVLRMAAAREMQKPKFEESLRGQVSPQHDVTDNSHHQNPASNTKVKPFHLRSQGRQSAREKETPFLTIEVELSAGKQGRIGVHHGDKPEELAHNFAKAYGLDFPREQKLTDLIRGQIQAHLVKTSVRTVEF